MQITIASGLKFEVEVYEPENASDNTKTILLIAGMSQQLLAWPMPFVNMLRARGYRVIRFDNRDIGLSQYFDHLGLPNIFFQGLRYSIGSPVQAPYTVADMANDTWQLLDALHIRKVSLVGISLGGMIAQVMAAIKPERVEKLTLMMTTSGARGLPGPTLATRKMLMSRPKDDSLEARIAITVSAIQHLGSPAYPTPLADLQTKVREYQLRAYHPLGSARQMLAGMAGPDRSPLLASLKMPVHIIHGEQDCLIPIACGRDLAKKIPHATTDFIEGMSHDLPVQLYGRFAGAITG